MCVGVGSGADTLTAHQRPLAAREDNAQRQIEADGKKTRGEETDSMKKLTFAVVVLVITAVANGIEVLTRLLRLIGYLATRA